MSIKVSVKKRCFIVVMKFIGLYLISLCLNGSTLQNYAFFPSFATPIFPISDHLHPIYDQMHEKRDYSKKESLNGALLNKETERD